MLDLSLLELEEHLLPSHHLMTKCASRKQAG